MTHSFAGKVPKKARGLDLTVQQNCHPNRSVPGFPATQLWTKPRVRLSLKERRMRSANATNVHRKSGVAKWRDLPFLFRFSHTLKCPSNYKLSPIGFPV
jgi:hypothetical protein